ncbi:hypothetical protein EDB85DRAFT_1022260 [Lactarius pseudohatsudake]|nr:hypothetical protein EDB85DRAFT_1022260 [Lactarius pseudohatsudake]
MANLVRSAKSGSDWKYSDLDFYNIQIRTVHTQEFFGVPHLPAPAVNPIILNHLSAPVGLQLPRDVRLFFRYLLQVDATRVDAACEELQVINDFSLHLLSGVLRFDEPDRMMNQGPDLRFVMSGKLVCAEPVVALQGSDGYHILLVQQDKGPLSQDQAEPQLVASALAAFHTENSGRIAKELSPLPSKRYLGIVMVGVAPHFYKITITQALQDAVRHSQFPDEETIVQRFVPPVPNMDDFLQKGPGMLPLDNRRICFQCFEALRTLL